MKKTIQIREVAGSEFCVAQEDGERLHDVIVAALEQGTVALSLEDVAMLTTPFIRAAIGEMYSRFSEERLQSSLSLENISSDNLAVFKFVVDDIKRRLRDPESYDRSRRHALELA